jgi:hypothetical protein
MGEGEVEARGVEGKGPFAARRSTVIACQSLFPIRVSLQTSPHRTYNLPQPAHSPFLPSTTTKPHSTATTLPQAPYPLP